MADIDVGSVVLSPWALRLFNLHSVLVLSVFIFLHPFMHYVNLSVCYFKYGCRAYWKVSAMHLLKTFISLTQWKPIFPTHCCEHVFLHLLWSSRFIHASFWTSSYWELDFLFNLPGFVWFHSMRLEYLQYYCYGLERVSRYCKMVWQAVSFLFL